LFLFLPALASAAPVPKEFEENPGLEGTWVVETMHSQGQEIDLYKGAKWKIGKDTIQIEYPEGIRVANPNVTNSINRVDNAASPKALDYTNYQGTIAKPPSLWTAMSSSWPSDPNDRPAEGVEGRRTNLFYTFRRVKE